MQRQSLGGGGSSPGSKHHHHHHQNINGVSSKEVSRLLFDDEEESKEDITRKERGVLVQLVSEIEEENKKKGDQKHRHHLRSISSRTEKTIHLIPILTIFCLLILYLCSYDPPLKDLAHIDGFRRISKRIELDDDDQNNNNKGVVGDVLLPIRSHRSLHEIPRKDGRKSLRFHRKIGDYSTAS